MIKARLSDGGLFFGLSAQNLQRLQEGAAIVFDLASMGLPAQTVIIAYGPTEQSIFDAMKRNGCIDDTTVIRGEPDAAGRQ